MTHVTSAQRNPNGNGASAAGRHGADAELPAVPSIPLTDDRAGGAFAAAGEQSVGGLVKDATTHLSTLVRAEIELAKSEITGEVKKGLMGSAFFVGALTVLLFSSFFFFFALAELLYDLGLYRSLAFGIVWLLMLIVAGLAAFLGYRKVKTIKGPKRTISTMKDTASAFKRGGDTAEVPVAPTVAGPNGRHAKS
ncbi:phage holin family protein [Herbihabitans rhizosphaerae]|nr:phage holin family protein [Herbihabitans rhizosphaerae]